MTEIPEKYQQLFDWMLKRNKVSFEDWIIYNLKKEIRDNIRPDGESIRLSNLDKVVKIPKKLRSIVKEIRSEQEIPNPIYREMVDEGLV